MTQLVGQCLDVGKEIEILGPTVPKSQAECCTTGQVKQMQLGQFAKRSKQALQLGCDSFPMGSAQ